MKNDKKLIISQIKPLLPYGWNALIRKALEKKGIKYTRQYISQVISDKTDHYNSDIIEVALDIAANEAKRFKNIIDKTQQLCLPQ